MELKGGDIDGNGGGKDDPVSEPFDFKIREDRVFFAGYVREADNVVFSQIFHTKSPLDAEILDACNSFCQFSTLIKSPSLVLLAPYMALPAEKTALMDASWLELLQGEFEKPYMKSLEAFLAQEIGSGAEVYPPFPLIFNAFCQTPFDQVKVVIMGQDPYHGPGQAHGLSFSVPKGVPQPPSLQNIFKEIRQDLGLQPPGHGCLEEWAKQGVLLLNATLTVRANEAKSHHGKGWEQFTDKVVQLLCCRKDPIAFVLWGKSALEKFQHIEACSEAKQHLVLTSAHPSPLSAHSGFFGCHHFSKVNEFLKKAGKKPIDWKIHGS